MGKKVLVIGGDSLIGKSLVKKLIARGDGVIHTTRKEMTLGSVFLDLRYVETFLESNPPVVDVVVICAAIAKFDMCRNDPHTAYQINVLSPLKIAEYYSGKGSRIVFLSSSAVFNGKTPFELPKSLPNSENQYGKLKAKAEKKLTDLNENIVVLRFSKIISSSDNIFSFWLGDMKKGVTVSAFVDQYISPVSLIVAIKALVAVIDDTEGGIYQFSADGDVSYYDVLSYLGEKIGMGSNLIARGSALEKGIPEAEIFRYNSLESSRIAKLLRAPSPEPLAFLDDLHFKEISE